MPERDDEHTCLVCKLQRTGGDCPRCGVNDERLREAIGLDRRTAAPVTAYRTVRASVEAAARMGEAVWELLSDGFREETLTQYAALSRAAARLQTAVMVPVTAAAFVIGFVAAAVLARAVLGWPAGVLGQTLFAAPFMFVLAMAVGIYTETRLARAKAVTDEREFTQSVSFIALALQRRAPRPWYLSGDVLFPSMMALVVAVGAKVLQVLG